MARSLRWVSLALALATAMPLSLGILAGFHLRLSPFLFLQGLFSRGRLVPLSILGFTTVLFVACLERGFCRYACPMGALCDALSALGRNKRSWDRFPGINRILCVLSLAAAAAGAPFLAFADPVAIFYGGLSFMKAGLTAASVAGALGMAAVLALNLQFPRLWCARLCPMGGLQLLVWDLRRMFRRARLAPSEGPVLSRRHVIAAASGAGLGLVAPGIAGAAGPVDIRPPGALPDGRFKATCCRCGNCARACPTAVIRQSFDLRDPAGFLAPRLDFSRGYCLRRCDACGRMCPTGAIAPFSAGEKDRIFIGMAEVRADECLLARGRECDRCVAVCPYGAIRIGGDRFEAIPEVDPGLCVGCGACVAACPPAAMAVHPRPR